MAPGYVFSDEAVRSIWGRHVRSSLGYVASDELARLYESRATPNRLVRFALGDQVSIKRGHSAEMIGTVLAIRKGGYIISVEMFGRECSVWMPENSLVAKEKTVSC